MTTDQEQAAKNLILALRAVGHLVLWLSVILFVGVGMAAFIHFTDGTEWVHLVPLLLQLPVVALGALLLLGFSGMCSYLQRIALAAERTSSQLDGAEIEQRG